MNTMWLLGSPEAPECGRNLIIFLYVKTRDESLHRWYFPLACLWDIGASEYKLYSLARGDNGDDASDAKKKKKKITTFSKTAALFEAVIAQSSV